MRKTAQLILILVLATHYLFSQTTINKDEIVKATVNFMSKTKQLRGSVFGDNSNPKELIDSSGNIIAYVVELKPQGFIVFSSLKEQEPVIAFSNEGNFNFLESDNILFSIIKRNKKYIDITIANSLPETQDVIDENINKWEELLSSTQSLGKRLGNIYGPLLTNVWGSVNCYDDTGTAVYTTNYFTPWNYSAGCVAISMSQVLHYHQWPRIGVGSHTYNDSYGSSQKTYSVDFSNSTYDYANMLDIYQGVASTDTQQRACGKLAYDCAVSVDMDFESTGSTSNVTRQPTALDDYFRFAGHYETPGGYGVANFWNRVRQNMSNGLPVLLSIYDADSGAGHALVIDGYDENTGQYHLNWGWYNDYGLNGWYSLESWSPGDGGYDTVNGAVLDVLPDPEITDVTRTSVEREFTVKWAVSNKLPWESFSLEQSKDGAAFVEIANGIIALEYAVTVADAGTYKYRVRAKVKTSATTSSYYLNSYSEEVDVVVKDDIIALYFDGDDSFFLNDNANNDLDVSTDYTIETWFKVGSHTSGTFPLLLDIRYAFSLYVIDDTNISADYALRFAARDNSDALVASVRSDGSSAILKFNTWHHVAISRDGTTTRMFIDGNQVDSSTDVLLELQGSIKSLNIGARYWGVYERYLDGALDGISISKVGKYTSNFTPDILVNYPIDANTVLAMNLDEGTGTSIGDATGNFSNATLRASPNMPNWYFESYVSETYIWDGYENSVWENPNNWISASTMSLPRSGDDIVIDLLDAQRVGNDAAVVLPSNDSYKYNSLHVKTGNNLNFPSDINLTLSGDFVNEGTIDLSTSSNLTIDGDIINSGVFTINSDATGTGSLIANGNITNTGTINIERYLNDPAKWQLVSSPTNNEVSGIFQGHFLNNYIEGTGVFEAIYKTGTRMDPGEGYASKLDWGTTDGVADNPNPIVFKSDKPNTTSLNFSLDVTDDDINSNGAHVSNTYFDLPLGFHLMGNPYSSNLDWNEVYNYGSNSLNITEYLYFYIDASTSSDPDHITPIVNGWQVYRAGTASSDSLISLGQGFGVVMVDNNSTKTFTIPNSARTHATTLNIFNKKQKTNEYSFEIVAVSDVAYDKSLLSINENATEEYDSEYDAYKIKSFSDSPVVSFVGDDEQRLAVSETPFVETVRLGLDMSVSGTINLSLNNVSDFTSIVLEDKIENKFIDLIGNTYSFFYTDNVTDNNRFLLHLNQQVLRDVESNSKLGIYSNEKRIFIDLGTKSDKVLVEIYNLSGQKVYSESGIFAKKEIDTNLADGIYIIKVITSDRNNTSKVLLR